MGLTEISLLVSIVLGISGAMVGMYKHFNSKIDRVYERFDEYKKHIGDAIENKFVRQDICKLLHNDNAKAYAKLEIKVDEGFQRLYDKIDNITEKYQGNAGVRGPIGPRGEKGEHG